MQAGIDDEREALDRADDDPGARVAAAVAARAPDLAVDLHLAVGPELDDGDAALADERLDADRRLAPLRPPDEEARLGDLEHAPTTTATSPHGEGRTKIASRTR